ncbi:MAG: arginine--tRNA ligase [Acidobacteriota bacterium]
MFLRRIEAVETYLRQFIRERFNVKLERLTAETPPRVDFGDLAFPFPFELAKVLRKAPGTIAQEVVENIHTPEEVDRFEAAGAGYVNVFFKRAPFFQELYEWIGNPLQAFSPEKVIVEHTNINPNKAAHIGHLRNAVLGDTFVRLLRASGRRVEIQNYIDNTGVQVADVIVGFQQLRNLSLEQVQAIEDPFDYYCWDLYAQVSDWYSQDQSRLEHRNQALKEIEEEGSRTAALAEYVSSRIVQAHLNTMLRIGVKYDVLPRESEILHLKFWDEAFQQLKEREAITFVLEGVNKGCWVIRLAGETEEEGEEKIIVRSNGTVTYVGKDIAYQLWKFGLLGKDFHYRPFFHYPDGQKVWVTSTLCAESQPEFGRGHSVYNVIDVRQSYLQRVVVQGLRSLGFEEQAARSVHFAYEMVALSPACCAELGLELSEEDRSRPYVEVSGRKGLGVKADDLVNKLIEHSLQEVNARQKDLDAERRSIIARQIAVGALRYFLLKYTRNAVIAFDFSEALSFEGETGPYLQYSVVRANNIFKKLQADDADPGSENWKENLNHLWNQAELLEGYLSEDEIWNLLLLLARIEEALEQSVRTMEVSYLAKHIFSLAQQFNFFYHGHHILSEQDLVRKSFYLAVADTARQGLLNSLELLGIEVPEKM